MPSLETLTGLVTSLVTAACAIGALVTANRGLATWRDQLYGTTEYEKARRLYRALLEIRDQVASARVPFVPAAETSAAFEALGLVPNHEGFKRDERSTAVVYEARWARVQKAYSDFQVELLDAEVLWGQAIRAPEKAIHDSLVDLRWSFDKFLDSLNSPVPRTAQSHDEMKANGRVMNRSQVDDEFAARLEQSLRDYEKLLRPHLRRR